MINKPPLLIVFEGVDGAGKSTQAERLIKTLKRKRIPVIKTRWNSSRTWKPPIKIAKDNRQFVPVTYCLAHATDFYERQEREVKPALISATNVVADRWFYTGLARDVARGLPEDYVNNVYKFGLTPTLVIYLRLTLEQAYKRIHQGRQPKFYEAGMDLNLSADIHDSYTLFTQRVIAQYDKLAKFFGFSIIDGWPDAQTVEDEVWRVVAPLLGQHEVQPATSVRHLLR